MSLRPSLSMEPSISSTVPWKRCMKISGCDLVTTQLTRKLIWFHWDWLSSSKKIGHWNSSKTTWSWRKPPTYLARGNTLAVGLITSLPSRIQQLLETILRTSINRFEAMVNEQSSHQRTVDMWLLWVQPIFVFSKVKNLQHYGFNMVDKAGEAPINQRQAAVAAPSSRHRSRHRCWPEWVSPAGHCVLCRLSGFDKLRVSNLDKYVGHEIQYAVGSNKSHDCWRPDEGFRTTHRSFKILHEAKDVPARTVQGGGGSFKDRKPIGEVRCCESRMAEQSHWWTERWLERRPIYLSIYLPV